MNLNINKTSFFLLFVISILCISISLKAQEDEPEILEPYMEFSYWKNTQDQKVLRVKMSYFTDLFQLPIEGLEIKFYTGETDPVFIGSELTNERGLVNFIIDDKLEIPLNEDGLMYFNAEFEETDKVYGALEEVLVQDVDLDMVLEQHEGERQIILSASTIIDGERFPVSGEDIFIFIPRMFSDLQVGEGYFEDDGTTMVEFPSNIPGDSLGNIIIVARFNDHYLYGNVEKREEAPWGIPSYHEGPGDVRALWTQIAPKWMIVTLSILLAGVWGHYVYAIVSIVRIKKNGKIEKEIA